MRAKRRDRAVPLKKLVPNMLTAAALCCGLASVHFAIEQNFERAVIALLIAAIFDALDGRARGSSTRPAPSARCSIRSRTFCPSASRP